MADVKKGDTVILASTRKGLFVFHSKDRKAWTLRGPYFEGIEVKHATLDARDGKTIWAAANSYHWGATVQRSASFGSRWKREPQQPAFPKGTADSMKAVWHVEPGINGELWAGVEPAGLFRSGDEGKSWQGIDGLNARADRAEWSPGGGGLCLHTILPHPKDDKRMVVAISAVGVLETRDKGVTWHTRNGGVRADFMPDKVTQEHQIGSCPHKVVRDPDDPDTLYMQNHCGVFKRKDSADKWTDITRGLPSRFGFPIVTHPRDSVLYTIPLESSMNRVTTGGALKVWRSPNAGKSWEALTKGLPQKNAWATILRDGMATDTHDKAGVYFGTTTGQLYASRNEGDSWSTVAEHLPPIQAVQVGIAR